MNSKKIKLILYDFDGVMTDNKVVMDQFGNESVIVNRSDGLAIAEINRKNIQQMIISTEKNPVIQKRAEKLNIPFLSSVKNKKREVQRILKQSGIKRDEVMFIGNDINDLEAMKFVGYPVSPNDAHIKINNISKIVTKSKGGEGVIRELLDILIEKEMI